ncbi:MAG: acyl-CoA dehydrogenase [Hyphomicrobiales bacterium]|nr:acyl-CoA dehydrogenase [Hyphomicrobiales bacterium]
MNDQGNDDNGFSAWIGRVEENSDIIDVRQARGMQTIIDSSEKSEIDHLAKGDELPLLWHWLYFPTSAPLDELGRDGHPKLGGFLPPVELPRRMWAGGRLQFLRPLKIGDQVKKKSTIRNIRTKNGQSGSLCFVTVLHEFTVAGELCLSEEHDIVYREHSLPGVRPPKPPDAPDKADWKRIISPDPVMLFRYSALTFNGHRIHYDRDYCMRVEGLEGLVVHGPLTATLLVDMAVHNNPQRLLKSFKFRAISPLFDTSSFAIAGQNQDGTTKLWAQNWEGQLAMQAEAVFE